MKINNRLKTLGDLVDTNSFCLDVGCDHALLSIYLVKLNQNIKVIASDVLEGPLNYAKNNIKKEGLEQEIETRLGNGLDVYTSDIDTILISGMGGKNMIGIFKNNKKFLSNIKSIIISPNTYQKEIKNYLISNNFYIKEEKLVKEKKHIYQIIKLEKGRKKYSKKEAYFGPKLLQNKDDLFFEYYQKELKEKEIILKILPKYKYFKKKYIIKGEIKLLKSIV